LSFAGSYRDKHGNAATITFGSATINSVEGNIGYTIPYTLTDSEGNKSGVFKIFSEFHPGRDPNSDDFVLNVEALDLTSPLVSKNAAQLQFRNNPNVSPLAPILLLIDRFPAENIFKFVYDDPKWGCWIIRNQSHIADYPIELLDARVLTQLLEPAKLSQLPGNWAAIMENHRTNFEEAKFRADIDFLGATQSDLLTSRIILELQTPVPGSPQDWLVRHSNINHGAITFLTDHTDLIEDMDNELFNNYSWPLNFSFPFGRMPVWLVDPDLDADFNTPHLLPLHWERVMPGLDPLANASCYHDYPLSGYTPTLTNGSDNIGQWECAQVSFPDGFNDRPCVLTTDYAGIGSALEGSWHDLIHGFTGGAFGDGSTTAGTVVFWAFHTYASTIVLSNWRHAQKRDMGVPTAPTMAVPTLPAWGLIVLILGMGLLVSGSKNRSAPNH